MLITNISRLVTMEEGKGRDGPLGVIEDAAVSIRDGKFFWLGNRNDLPDECSAEEPFDAGGAVALPGLIDCHTHLVHAGSRQDEFAGRARGRTYQETASAGGGIMSTVRATRKAGADELLNLALARVGELESRGVTTFEVKTGYGLDLEAELKMVEVIRLLSEKCSAEVFGTFLGAHTVPEEFRARRTEYVRQVTQEMLPAVARHKVIRACDVFVDECAFANSEAEAIAKAARTFGLDIHLHVDQFSDGGGAELAVKLGARNASHMDFTNDKGLRAMAKAGVVGVVLPGASFFAHRGRYPDARKMVDLGVAVAVSTDCNPGTNPSLDLLFCASTAVTQMGLTCEEVLQAVTKNAALALGFKDRGVVAKGMRGDIALFDAPDEDYILYRYGTNMVRDTVFKGCHSPPPIQALGGRLQRESSH